MIRSEILKEIAPILRNQLVVCNIGIPSQELHAIDDQPTNFYMLGTMGLASSIGLGLALAQPKTVIAIDGDGSVLTNLGTLPTIGNNAPPNRTESSNCSDFLRRQIELVDPAIVVTLGAVALRALEAIEPHGLVLRDAVAQRHVWWKRTLIPLYHPGARALIHRPRQLQCADYRLVADELKTIAGNVPAIG